MSLPVLLPCVTRRCDSACCDAHEVPLTDHDITRLAAGTGRPAASFVDEVDGWRLLRGAGVADSGCIFLGRVQAGGNAHRGCTVHAHRPDACRLYPFVLARPGTAPVMERDAFCPYAGEFELPENGPERLSALWTRLRAERVVRRTEGRAR